MMVSKRPPAGKERARQRPDAPPRRKRADNVLSKPDLQGGSIDDLPRGVRNELRRIIGNAARRDAIGAALALGSSAVDEDRIDDALPVLRWARQEAPASPSVREAIGVAAYLAENWAEAARELKAYRRLSGNDDQNHLIADCMRAQGKPLDQIAAVAAALVERDDVAVDRRLEGLIVWASAVADDGDVRGARALIDRQTRTGDLDNEREATLRLRYVIADLASRDGDTETAIDEFTSLRAISGDLFDVDERLADLGA